MIIFNLDGTLANCEHRRHYVDPVKAGLEWWNGEIGVSKGNWTRNGVGVNWKPDWKAFYEACDKDEPIEPVVNLLRLYCDIHEVEVWSGRCESVREMTEEWFDDYTYNLVDFHFKLRMRPIGDYTPDDKLKERWLHERCADLMVSKIKGSIPVNHDIEAVFDDRPKVVRMWRRYGIFVFDCNQTGKEF